LGGGAISIVKRFLKQTARTKPEIRELVVPGPKSDWYIKEISNPRHEVRTLPKDASILSDLILFKSSVLVTNYTEQSARSVLIEDVSFSHSLKGVFELLWIQGRKER
jgi:hypothetical protein